MPAPKKPTPVPSREITNLSWSDRSSSKTLDFLIENNKLVVNYNPNDDGLSTPSPSEDPAYHVAKFLLATNDNSKVNLTTDQLPYPKANPLIEKELSAIYAQAANDLIQGTDHRLELYQYNAAKTFSIGLALAAKAGFQPTIAYPQALNLLHQCGLPYSTNGITFIQASQFDAAGNINFKDPEAIIPDPNGAEEFLREFQPEKLAQQLITGELNLPHVTTKAWLTKVIGVSLQAATLPNDAIVPKEDPYIRLLGRNDNEGVAIIKVTDAMIAEFKTLAVKLNIPIPTVKKATKLDKFIGTNPELEPLVELRKLQLATPRSKLVWTDTGHKTSASLQVNQKDARGSVVAEVGKVEGLNKELVTSKWKELCKVVESDLDLGR